MVGTFPHAAATGNGVFTRPGTVFSLFSSVIFFLPCLPSVLFLFSVSVTLFRRRVFPLQLRRPDELRVRTDDKQRTT